MEGLLQPTHLMFIIIIAAPIVIAIRVARYRHARCNWSKAKTKKRLWVGIVSIIVSVVVPSIPGQINLVIPAWFLFVAGLYQTSKAVYRRRDMRSAEDAFISSPPTKP
jgi:hypothetical protein